MGFIEKTQAVPITKLIYVRDVPLPEPNAVQISVASNFTYNAYKLTAIEGMEGYYVVSFLFAPDILLGFLYDDHDRKYFFEIGYLMQNDYNVNLRISASEPGIPKVILDIAHLKTLIEEINPELFIETWKEYNLSL